jgi:hypothetical protein
VAAYNLLLERNHVAHGYDIYLQATVATKIENQFHFKKFQWFADKIMAFPALVKSFICTQQYVSGRIKV